MINLQHHEAEQHGEPPASSSPGTQRTLEQFTDDGVKVKDALMLRACGDTCFNMLIREQRSLFKGAARQTIATSQPGSRTVPGG